MFQINSTPAFMFWNTCKIVLHSCASMQFILSLEGLHTSKIIEYHNYNDKNDTSDGCCIFLLNFSLFTNLCL